MTSYNNEPGPENNLNDYLLTLCGFSKTEGIHRAEPTQLTPEHASYVGDLMTKWLPSLLHTYNLDTAYTQNHNDYDFRNDGVITERVTQEWGDVPDIIDMLATGSLVEIAGPSSNEDYEKFFVGLKPMVMMNIDPTIEGVTIGGDARHTLFASESVGTLFISGLPGAPREFLKLFSSLRPEAIAEAARIIQQDGYLIWTGGTSDDVQDILNLGFTPEYMEVISELNKSAGLQNIIYKEPHLTINGVFRKVA